MSEGTRRVLPFRGRSAKLPSRNSNSNNNSSNSSSNNNNNNSNNNNNNNNNNSSNSSNNNNNNNNNSNNDHSGMERPRNRHRNKAHNRPGMVSAFADGRMHSSAPNVYVPFRDGNDNGGDDGDENIPMVSAARRPNSSSSNDPGANAPPRKPRRQTEMNNGRPPTSPSPRTTNNNRFARSIRSSVTSTGSAPSPMTTSSNLSSYGATSISKHYALNNQILTAFDSLYQKRCYKVAYAIGMQFVEVALLEIPKHGYFYSPKHQNEREQNCQDALRVTKQMHGLLQNELKSEATEADRVRWKKLNKLALDQSRGTDPSRYCQELQATEDLLEKNNAYCGLCCASPAEYQDIMMAALSAAPTPPPPSATRKKSAKAPTNKDNDDQYEEHLVFVDEPSMEARQTTARRKSNRASLSPRIDEDWNLVHEGRVVEDFGALGRPDLLERTSSEMDLERALFLSGMVDVNPYVTSEGDWNDTMNNSFSSFATEQAIAQSLSAFSSAPSWPPAVADDPTRKKKSKTSIDMNSLVACYSEDFDQLRQQGRVRIYQTDTYQGKQPGSINGCTVIAPLLCIHHFHNYDNAPHLDDMGGNGKGVTDHGLPDDAVMEVIDRETPAILPEVRNNLGLTKDALIIPSDVHDYLIEKQLLSTDQFVSVCGGNILDHGHLQGFVGNLTGKNGRVAATFFFHEHVVAILPLRRGGDNQIWFDLIDSLPKQATLRKSNQEFVPNAARIRCVDEEALIATLLWYACSRFTDENKAFVDMYDWDEAHSDFDPRVFQAFIWAEVK